MSKKFFFVVESAISMSVEVTADNLDEAIEKAQNAPVMGLCHQCADGELRCWNTSGELDCDPPGSSLVDVMVDEESLSPDELETVKEQW